ncbi:pyridoxamine 5'-phosphate oxidase family protein [Streptomyces cinnabarinus]|uniref:Pyridoxamine 5'-phosphate oxidase family protein n=1 Tax=Streptomyces cinnabarinus TaxID=67287 RepID=A0ABY7K6G6_9ACTN|nr:pyridoxamine 5'-phosphate oxidase family protein [Streptomyces cinnabarinus]WAZ19390.1 pyridoxamine 5'-phosphate oxidase family protein [Streptomyces cinnabarinus]
MTNTGLPRTPDQRRRDVLERLERELDVWVATADPEGVPCMVALWFVWDGQALWVSTRGTNPTGRNLREGGRTRLAFGDTQDVVLIDGEAESFTASEVPDAAAEAFRAKTGWDPRTERAAYAFFRVRPRAVQAWHGVRELPQRHLMKDGRWLV